MRFASPRRAWSGDVLDGSGCGRRAHAALTLARALSSFRDYVSVR